MRRVHERLNERLAALDGRMSSLSPLAVLQRGYSITTAEDGSVVRRAVGLDPGSRIRTRLLDGQILSVVEATDLQVTGPRVAGCKAKHTVQEKQE